MKCSDAVNTDTLSPTSSYITSYHFSQCRRRVVATLIRSAAEVNGVLSSGQALGQEALVVQLFHTCAPHRSASLHHERIHSNLNGLSPQPFYEPHF